MLAKRLQLETVRRMSAVTTSSYDPLEADGPPEPAGRALDEAAARAANRMGCGRRPARDLDFVAAEVREGAL
jgi:hypothetical protein